MIARRFLNQPALPSPTLVSLVALLILLFLAGGASRPDALGQAIVRGGAWIALAAAALFAKPDLSTAPRAPWCLFIAALTVTLLQLIPLPPSLWQALPGRALISEGPTFGSQPWRPLSLAPSATINAAGSLIVPAAVLILTAGLRPTEKRSLPALLLIMAGCALVVSLLQFSGAGFDNTVVNESPGEVSGLFANRNHFALFLAIGCVVAPAWAFSNREKSSWLALLALGICVLSTLSILATGSRSGVLLGGLALILALLLTKRDLQGIARRHSRWVVLAMIAGTVGVVLIFLLLSVAADRAVSIDRLLAMDVGQDMRARGLPIVLDAITAHFPVGSGLGGFDPVFRSREPIGLLKPTYFNHAHNDFLEILLDSGIAGLALLAAGLAWWVWASVEAWWRGNRLSRVGSAILLLTIVASLFDYPLRTPLILGVATVAAIWLSERSRPDNAAALPRTTHQL